MCSVVCTLNTQSKIRDIFYVTYNPIHTPYVLQTPVQAFVQTSFQLVQNVFFLHSKVTMLTDAVPNQPPVFT